MQLHVQLHIHTQVHRMAGSEEMCTPTSQEEFQLREMCLNPRQVYMALKDCYLLMGMKTKHYRCPCEHLSTAQ